MPADPSRRPDLEAIRRLAPIGRRIVITGASRGIGAATARALAQPGRRMLLLARSGDLLASLAEELAVRGADVDWAPVDLTGTAGGQRGAELARERLGVIDAAVLVAGTSTRGRFVDVPLADLEREAQVNYLAPLAMCRGLLPAMVARGRGRVALVGSIAGGPVPFPTNAGYAASKAALLALVRSLRPELRGTGVHVGIVLPGHTRTEMGPEWAGVLPSSSADEVAAAIVRCLERREGVTVPGLGNRLLERIAGLFPGPLERALTWTGDLLLPGAR